MADPACAGGFCIWTLSGGVWQATNHCVNNCVCSNVPGNVMTNPVFVPWARIRGVTVHPTDTQVQVTCEPAVAPGGGGGT